MNVADRVCDLECVGNKGKSDEPIRHEFVGPVRIVLVELSASDYRRKIWGSAIFTFIMMLIGITVFTVFFFTLAFKLPLFVNLHVFLCTMGLFMPTGILMFSPLFGGSMYLTPKDRMFQHFILEIFGVITGSVGTFLMFPNIKYTCHALTGFVGVIVAVLGSVIGLTIYFIGPENMDGQFMKETHRFCAVSSFLLCMACFILGILKESFIKWIPIKNLQYILICFTLLFSLASMMSTKLRTTYGT